MSALMNHIYGQIPLGGQARFGIVTSYNPANHTCRIRFEPDDYVSDDLPISTMAAGASSIRYAPMVGQMAYVVPDSGDMEHLVVIGFAHSDVNSVPPCANNIGGGSVQLAPGEFSIVTKDGIQMRFGAGGVLYVKANDVRVESQNAELKFADLMTVTCPSTNWTGNINLNGFLHATGNLISDMDVIDKTGSLNHLRLTYDGHLHLTGFAKGQTTPTTTPDGGGV
jgi:phage baseplate assembly protein gpV